MTLSPEVSQMLVYLALAVGGWLVGLFVPGLKLPKLFAPPSKPADPPVQEVLVLLRKLLAQQEAAPGQKQ